MIERPTLPKLYAITDARLSGLSHAEQVARLADGGARLVQLREKYAAPREFYREAAAALEVARARGVTLIVNDRTDIALALRADGVHVGQDDLPPEAARRLLGEGFVVGYSTHSLAQIEAAARMPVSYVAFGPVFPTRTKENPDPVVGLSLLSRARAALAGDACVYANMILFQLLWNTLTLGGFARVASLADFAGRLFFLCFVAMLVYFPPRVFYLAEDARRPVTWLTMLLANSPVIFRVLVGVRPSVGG